MLFSFFFSLLNFKCNVENNVFISEFSSISKLLVEKTYDLAFLRLANNMIYIPNIIKNTGIIILITSEKLIILFTLKSNIIPNVKEYISKINFFF